MKTNDDHIGLDMVKLKAMFLLMKKNRQDKVGTDIEKKAPRFIPLSATAPVKSPLEVRENEVTPKITQRIRQVAPAAAAFPVGKAKAQVAVEEEQSHLGAFEAPISSGRDKNAPESVISKSTHQIIISTKHLAQ